MTKTALRSELMYQIKSLRGKIKLAFTMGWSFVIWLSASAYNHTGELLLIIAILLLVMGSIYVIAKDK